MWSKIFYFFFAILLFSNCSAYRYSMPAPYGKEELKSTSEFNEIVLGIGIEEDSLSSTGLQFSRDELVRKLQADDIFKEVNLTEHLENEPDLVLSSVSNLSERSPDCWSCLFTAVSLGIIPRIFRVDEEIQFTFTGQADSSSVKIRAENKYVDVFGWAAGFMRLSSKWKGDYDEDNFYNEFYNQLYIHKERFLVRDS